MPGNHVVEALDTPSSNAHGGNDAMTQLLARTLGVSVAEATLMHQRMPGVVAGPMPESAALKMVLQLQTLGITALHRLHMEGEPTPPTPAATVAVNPPPHTDAWLADDLLGDPDEPPITPVGPVINLATPSTTVAPPNRRASNPSLASQAAQRRAAVGASGRRSPRFARRLAAHVMRTTFLTGALLLGLMGYLMAWSWPPVWPQALMVAAALLLVALVAGWAAGAAARDVARVREEATRIADGALTTPVVLDRNDELGEIAGALEHLRVHLQTREP